MVREEGGRMAAMTLEDLVPRSKRVQAGGKVLVVGEVVSAKREALVKLIFGEMNVAGVVELASSGVALGTADGVGSIVGLVSKALGPGMTKLMKLLLDTPENRAAVLEDVPQIDESGPYDRCLAMEHWVRENVTGRQEGVILGAALEVNNIAELVKNYWTPISGLLEAITQVGEEQTQSKT